MPPYLKENKGGRAAMPPYLKEKRAELMWALYKQGFKAPQLGLIFGVHRSTAHEIIKQMPEGWESPWHKTK